MSCYLGNGVSDEYHVIRHCMNLEAVNTYEGKSVVFIGYNIYYNIFWDAFWTSMTHTKDIHDVTEDVSLNGFPLRDI